MTTHPRLPRLAPIAAAAIIAATGLLLAGPINPPPGPVTSTYKTLTEVEPRIPISVTYTPGDADSLFKITMPGSYYLTGNITGVAGKHGVEIDTSGVTLDLNGFDLVGIPAMGAFDGVAVTVGGLNSIAVLNGSVRNWGGDGVDLPVTNSRVEGVRARGNAEDGITVGNGVAIADCTSSSNTSAGIRTGSDCTVVDCVAYQNTGTGIVAGGGSTVSNCTTNANSAGIFANSGSNISACIAMGNLGNGIATGIRSTVSGCAASNNTGRGITIDSASTVAECTVSFNTLDGIQGSSSCVIRGNTCIGNGSGGDGAGIHTFNSDTRIEGNNCTGSDRGIDVDFGGNIIIKNSCSGNSTNWDVVAGNVILVVTATAAPAVIGDSGGVAPGSTDPNANFTY